MRPQDGLGSRLARWVWQRRKAARECCCGCCYARTALGDVCCGRGCGRGRINGTAAAYEANGRSAKDVTFREHTWLLRGAWGCCLRMRPHGGSGGSGGCHPQTRSWDGRRSRRLRERDCADGCRGRRTRKICSLLAFQSRAPHFATAFFVCILL